MNNRSRNAMKTIARYAVLSLLAAAWLTTRVGVAEADGALRDFRPSPVVSAHGKTSRVEVTSELILLKSGALGYCDNGSMQNFHFDEPVWLIGYKTEIFDPQGNPPRENHICHTFFSDHMPMEGEEQVLRSLYSDAFTREVRLPEGFGVPIKAGENVHWMPMFNNRGEQTVKVGMKYELTLIREKDLKKPLTTLYSTIRSVANPHLFFVAPGRHQQEATFTLPFNGRIHFMATHIHPYGESVELYNVSRRERVWTGARKLDKAGQMVGMETYSNREGYKLQAGETYRVRSSYNNTTDHWIDAMAGVVIFFSRE